MNTIFYVAVLFVCLLPLDGWGKTFGPQSLAAAPQQCFEKSPLTEGVPGAPLLPDKLCLDSVGLKNNEGELYLDLQGQPISGEFLLEPFAYTEGLTKFLTYIFEREFTHEKNKMAATIRVSVDVLDESQAIDYIYVVAEFFVYHGDGGHDVHMYYYLRK